MSGESNECENVEVDEKTSKIYDLKDLCALIGSKKSIVDLLFETRIFKNSQRCSNKACRKNMEMVVNSSWGDGCLWRCSTCKRFLCNNAIYNIFNNFREKSIRTGSFFARSKFPLGKLLTFTFCWSAGIQAFAQSQFSGVSEQCAVRWNLYLRDVCSTWLMNNPIQFGGKMLSFR